MALQAVLTSAQISEIQSLTINNTQDYWRAYEYISLLIESDQITVDEDTKFWFAGAAEINRGDVSAPATQHIYAVTTYGLQWDNQPVPTLQQISDAIGQNVIANIINEGGISDLSDILLNDIGVAVDEFGLTPGGWGGSFYYWDLPYNPDNSSPNQTLGDYILQDPNDIEKFLAINAAAILNMFGNNLEFVNNSYVPDIFRAIIISLSEGFTAFGAQGDATLDDYLKDEIVDRALSYVYSGFNKEEFLGGDTIIVGKFEYYRQGEDSIWRFFTPPNNVDVVTDLSFITILNDTLQVRADHIDEIQSLKLGTIAQCFPAGTPILLADGSETTIESIRSSAKVMAHDESGDLVPGRVAQLLNSVTTEWILLSTGTTVTPGHRYLQTDGTFEEISKMLEAGGGACEVVLADGSLQKVTGERIVYSAETAHLYEQGEKLVYETAGGLALQPKTVKGWKTYNFTVEKYHTYIADGVRVHNDSILSHVEAGDELLSLSSDLEEAAVVRGGDVIILDGTNASGATDTFINVTYTLALNAGKTVQDVQNLIVTYPELAGSPIDEVGADNAASDDLQDAVVNTGIGAWQLSFLGISVPTLAELAANPLGVVAALTGLANAVTGSITVDQEYSLGDGDVIFEPEPLSSRDILLTILGADENTVIVPGQFPLPDITYGTVLDQLSLPALGIGQIKLGAGIEADDVTRSEDGTTLTVDNGDGTTSTITLDESNGVTFEDVVFSDGSSQSITALSTSSGGGDGGDGSPDPDPTTSTITGTSGVDDPLNGTSGDDVIDPLGGHDAVYAGAGDDIIFASAGPDILYGGSGIDTVVFLGNRNEYTASRTQPDANGDIQVVVGGGADTGTALVADALVDIEFVDFADQKQVSIDSFISGEVTPPPPPPPPPPDDDPAPDTTNTILGGYRDDDIAGTVGVDSITGGNGNDTINGYGDSDTIDGGHDADSISGAAGDDSLLGGGAADTIDGGGGNDIVDGGVGADSITGGSGHDTLDGDGGADIIDGGDGHDLLFGGVGADSLTGGDGNDTIHGDTDDGTPDAGNDTLSGGNGDDSLYGGNGDDSLDGGTGSDFLSGNNGNDSLSGGGAADSLHGGTGDDTISGGDDADSINGGGGHDLIAGDGGNDSIFGNNGADSIDGGTGDDTLNGGTGDDTLDGGNGNDLLNGAADDDRLLGGIGDDSILGGAGDDALHGGNDNDTLDGGGGEDSLYGGDGNDSLNGGTGSDYLSGNDGDDNLAGDGSADSLHGGLGNDTLDGGDDTDTLDGGGGNDLLLGGGGDDSLRGNVGDDVLNGGTGDDFLNGGAGADTLRGEDGDDQLIGAAGDDSLYGGDGNDDLNGGAGDDIIVGGADNDTLSGSGGEDTLFGGSGDDTLDGGTGADTLSGGSGNDTLIGAGGNDTLRGNDGDDTLRGGAGADHLDGGDGTDVASYADATGSVTVDLDNTTANQGHALGDTLISIEGLDGSAFADDLRGNGDANIIRAYGGDDTVNGAGEDDVLHGGIGNDSVGGGLGNDTIFGEGDDDILIGHAGNDVLNGDSGNDTLEGRGDNDTLNGDGNQDVLIGGAGDDVLNGGNGNDTLTGGTGVDTFMFSDEGNQDENDVITDFEEGELLRFSGGAVGTIQNVTGGTLVTFTSNDSVLLLGVNASSITAADDFDFM